MKGGRVSEIFCADANDGPWSGYEGADGGGNIRFKGLTLGVGVARIVAATPRGSKKPPI